MKLINKRFVSAIAVSSLLACLISVANKSATENDVMVNSKTPTAGVFDVTVEFIQLSATNANNTTVGAGYEDDEDIITETTEETTEVISSEDNTVESETTTVTESETETEDVEETATEDETSNEVAEETTSDESTTEESSTTNSSSSSTDTSSNREEYQYEMYTSSFVNIRSSTDSETDDNKVGELTPGVTIEIIEDGIIADDGTEWVKINYGNGTAYMCADYMTEKFTEEMTYNYSWSGETLNKKDGTAQGPSGKETYYNLNMSKCIQYMNALGYYGEYWVRSDGAKMFGNYVMVAANLSKYPKGTIVETSLGKGIVVDTGDFTTNGSGVVFDIAVTW